MSWKGERRCPLKRPLRTPRVTGHRRFEIGPCEACGHGPMLHSIASTCGCSFERCGKRVCRDCARSYDVVVNGSTKIGGYFPVTAHMVSLVEQARDRAERVSGARDRS